MLRIPPLQGSAAKWEREKETKAQQRDLAVLKVIQKGTRMNTTYLYGVIVSPSLVTRCFFINIALEELSFRNAFVPYSLNIARSFLF